MKRTTLGLILTGGLAAALASSAIAEERGAGMRGGKEMRVQFMAAHIEKVDTNKDGIVSKEEATAYKKKMFKQADANGNGKVSQKELTAFREAEKARREKERQDTFFNNADVDGDGSLNEVEFLIAGPRVFDRFDRDGDGFVALGDMGHYFHRFQK